MKNIDSESLNSSLSQKIDSLINSGLSGQEAITESLLSISDSLADLGLSEDVINSIKTSSSSIFEQSLTDGLTVHEAINIVLKNIKETLENHNSSENIDNSADYNLNFVDPLNSEGAKLIDEGISQGLSVEDAIKNANLKLFPDQNIQGPQAISELKDIKNIEKKTVENKEKDLENQELNIIEADMDAQELNNIAKSNYDENISSENLDKVNEQEKLEEPNKDDEIS
ncbi:MAG: hypothetical protein CMM92_05685 [Rickettsiales bacterium]|nr:hypothetical protein [Rickettsiales bacterium]RPG13306.1 MAG: hypothetical protein CBD55_005660 [Pelagibacteraceae bacterium TMED195]|tara:strand:+ start:5440 stop:6120 length:681 start_codon:yes stop_codon:yes gene_type:complete